MHTANVAALAGVGLLVIGAMLSISDLALFVTPYALIMGPISWIIGCALMVAWAIGRVALAVDQGLKAQKRENRTSRAAASGSSHTRAVSGQIVTDFIVPLAIWLMLVSFLAAIVLLLGSEPASVRH